jgi:hypothetical protein
MLKAAGRKEKLSKANAKTDEKESGTTRKS